MSNVRKENLEAVAVPLVVTRIRCVCVLLSGYVPLVCLMQERNKHTPGNEDSQQRCSAKEPYATKSTHGDCKRLSDLANRKTS